METTPATHAFPRVRLAVPEGWVDESVITFVAPAKNGLAANVVITSSELAGDEWRTEVDRELRELKKQARGYRRIDDSERSHFGDPARCVEHAFLSADRVAIRQVQLYVFRAPYLYTATISHAEKEFEADRARWEEIFASLRFGDA